LTSPKFDYVQVEKAMFQMVARQLEHFFPLDQPKMRFRWSREMDV